MLTFLLRLSLLVGSFPRPSVHSWSFQGRRIHICCWSHVKCNTASTEASDQAPADHTTGLATDLHALHPVLAELQPCTSKVDPMGGLYLVLCLGTWWCICDDRMSILKMTTTNTADPSPIAPPTDHLSWASLRYRRRDAVRANN